MADGLDPNTTTIEKFMTLNPVTCREEEDVESCERLMQEHQIRRIPVVNAEDSVIGIVAQADLALKDKSERVSKTVAEISKPADPSAAAGAQPTRRHVQPCCAVILHDAPLRLTGFRFCPSVMLRAIGCWE